MQTHNQPAFDLYPAAIVTAAVTGGTPGGTGDQPVERMMAAQAAIGRLVDFICGLPVHLSFNPRPRPIGRAQPGDVR